MLEGGSLSISRRTTISLLVLVVDRLLLQCPQLPTYPRYQCLPKLVVVAYRPLLSLVKDLIMLAVAMLVFSRKASRAALPFTVVKSCERYIVTLSLNSSVQRL